MEEGKDFNKSRLYENEDSEINMPFARDQYSET